MADDVPVQYRAALEAMLDQALCDEARIEPQGWARRLVAWRYE
ncbi:hypothetical protein [Sphingomonas sp. M1A8_2b]